VFAIDPLRLTPPHAAGSTGVACVGCGRIHGPDQLIPLAGHPVCIDCKPRRLQCLREGIPNAGIRVAVGIHTENNLLVIHRGAVAPARCVRCNQPSTWNAQRRYAWHPHWVSAVISMLMAPLYGQRIHGVLFVKRIEPDGTLHLRCAHPDYLTSLSQPVTPNGWVRSADC
jgi:hypothetical protein